MLTLKCISTGSTANCYLLSNGKEILILDMGIKYANLITEIDDLDKVVGAVLSHHHTDHNAYNGKHRTSELLEQIGIRVLSPDNVSLHKKYKLGSFEIIPVENVHNVVCYGYVIRIDNEFVYFATDTSKLSKISNIQFDHLIVECNYCNYLVNEAMFLNDTNLAHLNSILKYHHSFNSLSEYLEDLGYNPKTIISIHKSNTGYFNEKEVRAMLKLHTPNAYVAKNNTTYILGGKNA